MALDDEAAKDSDTLKATVLDQQGASPKTILDRTFPTGGTTPGCGLVVKGLSCPPAPAGIPPSSQDSGGVSAQTFCQLSSKPEYADTISAR